MIVGLEMHPSSLTPIKIAVLEFPVASAIAMLDIISMALSRDVEVADESMNLASPCHVPLSQDRPN